MAAEFMENDPLMAKMKANLQLSDLKELEANVGEAREDILAIAYANLCTAALTMKYCDHPFGELLVQISDQFLSRHPELAAEPLPRV